MCGVGREAQGVEEEHRVVEACCWDCGAPTSQDVTLRCPLQLIWEGMQVPTPCNL